MSTTLAERTAAPRNLTPPPAAPDRRALRDAAETVDACVHQK